MRVRFRLHLLASMIVLILLSANGCGTSQTLTVFAAASLNDAFTVLGQQFATDHPGTSVTFNFAGSQQLAAQINQDATADVFASANTDQMQAVINTGHVANESTHIFVKNRLVAITPKSNPAGISTLHDLAKPGLKLVLADSTVPVGAYTITFLNKASADPAFGSAFKSQVLSNVVSYEDNVRSVYTKVQLGEADAGIVYTSDIALNQDKVGHITIPDMYNTIAQYDIAPLKNSKQSDLAQRFVQYVLSTAGQAILAQYGFITLNATTT